MVSDQANTRNPVLLMIFALIVLILTISIVMLYLSARQNSLAKVQPYIVELEIAAYVSEDPNTIGQLIVQYDYGYGFNSEHQQTLAIMQGTALQVLSFTVSGWKQLNSLKLISNGPSSLEISKVIISKNNMEYEASQTGSINENNSLLIEDVFANLIEVD